MISDGVRGKEDLHILRNKLLDNSRALLLLFQQRQDIARSIGELKRSMDLKIRDTEQEERVIKNLSINDPIEERFLNTLFELTIMSENQNETFMTDPLQNEDAMLQEILADFLCFPGDRISTTSSFNVPFIRKAVDRGAHIVDDIFDSVDLDITISRIDEDSVVSIRSSCSGLSRSPSRRSCGPRVIRLDVIE